MPTFKNVIGQKFGRLTVVDKTRVRKGNRYRIYWVCLCDCGGQVSTRIDSLTSGNVKSCGCLKKEQDKTNLTANHSHKMSRTRLYHTWQGMRKRCNDPTDHCYERYGGRGIQVCREWQERFEPFRDWALANGYSDNLTIDRIDNNGNYTPENCKWSTPVEQARNRRSNIEVDFGGRKVTLMELSEITGLTYSCVITRYKAGDRGDRLIRPKGELRRRTRRTMLNTC